MGKTHKRRPRAVSYTEWALNWDLAYGNITHNQFVRRYAKLSQKDLMRKF